MESINNNEGIDHNSTDQNIGNSNYNDSEKYAVSDTTNEVTSQTNLTEPIAQIQETQETQEMRQQVNSQDNSSKTETQIPRLSPGTYGTPVNQGPYGRETQNPAGKENYSPLDNPNLGFAYTPNFDHHKTNQKQNTKRPRAWVPLALSLGLVGGLIGGLGGSYLHDELQHTPRYTHLSTSFSTTKPVVNSNTKSPDWVEVAQAVGNTVVAIRVESRYGGGEGSGVIIDTDGHIVTNNHVVEDAKNIEVTLSNGEIRNAEVVGTDPYTDLAVVKLKSVPKNLPVASFAQQQNLRVGDPVAAIGNPLGLSQTMTTGIVSALERPVVTSSSERGGSRDRVATVAIQVDASINPGNSGGPLFNAEGQVVGINSSIATLSSYSGSVGLGFAIPADLVRRVADQLIAHGYMNHAYLGVLTNDDQASAEGKTIRGARIVKVMEGSPAENAGLKAGDLITEIDEHQLVSGSALAAWVRRYEQGDTVNLVIIRNGKVLSIDAVLAAQEQEKTQINS